VAVFDLLVKRAMTGWLDTGRERWLVDGWFGLELTRNRGIAFGIGEGSAWVMLLVVLGTVLLVAFASRAGLAVSAAGPIALGLAIGGALGNLVDRAADGSVTDFFVVGPWPRFNVADSALTLGLLLLVTMDIFGRSSSMR
jgi:signal peptidase II